MRKLYWCILICIAASALLMAALPSLLSSTFVRNLTLGIINKEIDGKLTIDELNLQWLGSQSIKGIRLIDSQDTEIISIEEIDADSSLLALIIQGNRQNPFHVKKLNAAIGQDASGVTNLEATLRLKKSTSSDFSYATFDLNQVYADLIEAEPGLWTLKAAGVTKQNSLKGQFNLDAYLGRENRIKLRAENFPVLFLDQTVALKNPALSGMLIKLLGDSLNLIVDGTHSLNNDTFSINAKSNFTSLIASGKVDEGLLKLDPSSLLQFAIPAQNIVDLIGVSTWELAQPLTGQVALSNFQYNLKKMEVEGVDGALQIEPARLKLAPEQILSLSSFSLKGNAKAPNTPLSLNLNSSGSFNQDPFSMEFSIDLPAQFLKSFDFDRILAIGAPAKGRFQGPVNLSFHGNLSDKDSHITFSLGYKNINLKDISLEIDELPRGKDSSLHIAFNGAGVTNENEQIRGNFHADSIGAKEFDLHLSLADFNPAVLQAIIPNHPVTGYTGTSVNASISANRLSNGDLKSSIDLTAPKDSNGFIKKLTGQFTLEQDLDLSFDLNLQQKIGSAQIVGSIQELFDKKYNLTPANAEINLKGHLQHFPVAIVTEIATGDKALSEKIEAVLGSQVSANLEAVISNNSGTIKADVKGLNGEAKLDGKIKEGALYLQQPLTASLKITPQLERAVFRELLPFLSYVASADEPIALTIANEGFRLPLHANSLDQISIASASIDLHKLQFSRDGHLGKVVSLLGVNSQLFEVWFTPVYFSLVNGQVNVQRVDMLVAQFYPIASWGAVDLNRQTLRFTIGLTPAALQNAFKVKTSSSYMLQIPVRGPLQKPEIDTAKVTTRISALIAQSQGGPQGLIIGTVLDAASGTFTEDKPPAPTTNPLPWNTDITKESGNSDAVTPEKIIEEPVKILDKPAQELQKGAKKLLKGLFG